MMSKEHDLATEIIKVLKFNAHLSEELKILAVESRLMKFANDVEIAYDAIQKRLKTNTIPISDYSTIIPKELLNKKVILN